MTTHIEGTNGRTFCGHKKGLTTTVVGHDLDANCKNCLHRLSQDSEYMFKTLMKLKQDRDESKEKTGTGRILTEEEKKAFLKKVKSDVDNAIDQCMIVVEGAISGYEDGTTKWLVAARVANRVWAIINKPVITQTLKFVGDEIVADT